jgi:hypothetical protein
MSGDHAKKMVIGGEKSATSHGKAPSRESANKKKDGSPSRIRSLKSGEKKKMKKVVVTLKLYTKSDRESSSFCVSYLHHKKSTYVIESD